MTLAEIREACKGQFALMPGSNDAFLTDAQWNSAINRAYRWCCFRVPLLTGSLAITIVADTREYPLIDDDVEISVVDFVQFKQQGLSWMRLGMVPFTRTSQLSTFQLQTGSPESYYTRGQNVGFYPIPDSSNLGAVCEVWGSLFPVLLEDDADEPEISAYQQDWLIGPSIFEMAQQVFNRSAGRMAPSQLQFYRSRRDESLTELRTSIEGRTSEAQFINTSLDLDGYTAGVW